ncbi:MAG: hypothetical protein U0R72_04425 [Nakamurella multipartita]
MAEYRIVRLQVQRGPVKVGRAPLRSYEPAAILPVDRILAGPRGVRGITADGAEILDVHHQDHPESRDRKGRAGVLFMGTGDYVALRARYGPHVVDGIAGETVLLDAPGGLAGRGLPPVVTVTTADGPLELHDVLAADPCVEFSRFCLGQEPAPTVNADVRQALVDLDHGARGYRSVAATEGVVRIGDLVTL